MSAVPGGRVTTVLARYWWTFALRGVLAILFGIMAWPDIGNPDLDNRYLVGD